ncbi:hypothetical protein VB711_23925 [Cronbergia sp. UHCC 0137]|uniref:hypothetical protein n=1 Tax=Cronbergia sp. UHCC 0137 TaxID=3110239 RepID=UPI002B202277|nr:hypothetical protein [Cronbergia sp. UHCC 0137]MEA5620864.1 hypothetical protein [Cronbergia sp. UHCC 0137]
MNQLTDTPLSSSAIAEFLRVSKPTISQYYKKIRHAYYWMSDSDFIVGSRNKRAYTGFCVQQMEQLSSSLNHEQWILDVQKQKPNEEISNLDIQVEAEIVQTLTLAKPDYAPLVVQQLELEVLAYDLTEIKQSTSLTLNNLEAGMENAGEAFISRAVERFKKVGVIAANQAFAAMTTEMNNEMERLANGGK